MHRRLVNMLRMELQLEPAEGISILSGEDPERLDGGGQLLKVLQAEVAPDKHVPVLPGSSLKGVVRSHCERIARSLGLWCCDPFDASISDEEAQRQSDLANLNKFCGKKIEERTAQGEELEGAERYRSHSCRICRLFGSTGIGSRVFIADALPRGAFPRLAKRPHVAIDRVLGSVKEGPWYEEVVESGRFMATLELRNFELWQFGLIGLALRDLREGRIRIGHSKSRGYGRVKLEVKSTELSYYGFALNEGDPPALHRIGSPTSLPLALDENRWRLYGVGALLDDEGRSAYGYRGDDWVEVTLQAASTLEPRSEWPMVRVPLTYDGQLEPFLEPCVSQRLAAAVTEGDT